MHQHAGVAVATHHASIARFTLVRNGVEVEHRAQRLVPCLTAPDVQVPVQIEVFVAADARDFLSLAAHIARDFRQRCPWIEHRKLFPEATDRIDRSEQLVLVEIDKM